MIRSFIFMIIALAAFASVNAQKPFRQVAGKYSNYNNYFASEVNRKTLQLYVKQKQPAVNVCEVLENIDELKVLSVSNPDLKSAGDFISEVGKQYNLSSYSPFKVIRKGAQNQLVYLKENGNMISELLVLNTNSEKMSLVEIKGKIDIKKVALLKDALRIEGLEGLSDVAVKQAGLRKNSTQSTTENELFPANRGINVYDKNGSHLLNSKADPSLIVNGYSVTDDFKESMAAINPNCIQSIHVSKSQGKGKSEKDQNGMIDILLNGNLTDVFTICEGTLYFGQNGYLQAFKIDDECSPQLLFDCKKKPLSELTKIEPHQIKSIKLTTNPLNCSGPIEGEFVVIETE